MNYTDNVLPQIGGTPLIELSRTSSLYGLETPITAKAEMLNPGGSVKDRVARAMIEDAEKRGVLSPGAAIIEPTSGNTGIGLALVSAVKGYRLILTMPETMSIERRKAARGLRRGSAPYASRRRHGGRSSRGRTPAHVNQRSLLRWGSLTTRPIRFATT